MRLYAGLLLAMLIGLAGMVLGLWWAPFIAAAAVGAIYPRGRTAIPSGAAIGLLAWLIPLAAAHGRYGLGPTAQSLAAIMGFGHQAVVPVVLTLMVGTLLGVTGAWLGVAGRRLLDGFAAGVSA